MQSNDEIENLNRLRNRVIYQGYKNSLIEWTLSDRWRTIPGFMNVRGECTERWLNAKSGARICRIVANGTISGEIQCP